MPNLRLSDGTPLKVRAIVAMDRQGFIGYHNDLIFHNPEDLKFFKEKTVNHICVMGRKTFESIGRILPRRQTVVVTSHPHEFLERTIGRMKAPDDTPFPLATKLPLVDLPSIAEAYGDINVYVCGGSAIYELFRPYICTYVVTEYSINVLEDGVKHGFLPEDFDERDLVRLTKKRFSNLNCSELQYGRFEGIRYTIKSYNRINATNTAAWRALKKDMNGTSDDMYI